MDCRTGEIFNHKEMEELVIKEVEKSRVELELEHRQEVVEEKTRVCMQNMVPTDKNTYQQLKPLPHRVRKNRMRNRKCICGSGKKFKKCCWSKYA